MENNENKNLKIMLAILIIVVLCLGGFIIYDKIINKTETKNNESKEIKNEQSNENNENNKKSNDNNLSTIVEGSIDNLYSSLNWSILSDYTGSILNLNDKIDYTKDDQKAKEIIIDYVNGVLIGKIYGHQENELFGDINDVKLDNNKGLYCITKDNLNRISKNMFDRELSTNFDEDELCFLQSKPTGEYPMLYYYKETYDTKSEIYSLYMVEGGEVKKYLATKNINIDNKTYNEILKGQYNYQQYIDSNSNLKTYIMKYKKANNKITILSLESGKI